LKVNWENSLTISKQTTILFVLNIKKQQKILYRIVK
jgi:hypothetical protein